MGWMPTGPKERRTGGCRATAEALQTRGAAGCLAAPVRDGQHQGLLLGGSGGGGRPAAAHRRRAVRNLCVWPLAVATLP